MVGSLLWLQNIHISPGLENGKSRDGDEHDRCVVCLERKCDAAFVP